ncbi:MarR family transcriptional regulator [Flavobacterium sp. LS1R49]|uniref:MarR family transcriptional regulator n=1 Tax=Flavobacterium shii TaxID=2987687 RepID=A0A9X2YTI7_9FLAO|nr:MarR family transcriptional regulator [Flavobacterium shii]MCV9926703.1 MarR family transcriptional regulator [Flavobacterium shii]
MAKPEQTIFYNIEESIKSYRQFAQKNINDEGYDITIDQGLILNIIQENPGISQKEISRRAFKDHASITRIIELLVKRDFLKRDFNSEDRRRFDLSLTEFGKDTLTKIEPIVDLNRKNAIEGVSVEEMELLKNILQKITANCRTKG